jgi:GTPase SAR1 family protein
MGKPKVDEYLMHFRNISNIMKRHKRIMVYALPGEGKTTLIRALHEKYEPEGWHFYNWGINQGIKEPFIYELPHIDVPKYAKIELPTFDLIYVVQYSRDYKEALTGVSFGDEYRPMADYVKKMKYNKAGRRNLGGQRFKSIEELQKALQGG